MTKDRATDLSYDPLGWAEYNRSRRRWSMASFIVSVIFVVKNVILAIYSAVSNTSWLMVVSVLLAFLWGWLAQSSWRSYRAH